MSSPQRPTDLVDASFSPLEADAEDEVSAALTAWPLGLSRESVVSEFEKLLSSPPTSDHVDSIEI